jgi:hypothetical protein
MFERKSKKLLIVSTALMVLALSSVLVVYAVSLGTFIGNPVTVNDVAAGSVKYSTDGSSYSADISAFNVGGHLYARFELTSNTATGSGTVTWQLQKNTGSWVDVDSPVISTVTLTGGAQTIYASANGNSTSNTDWGSLITTGGSYRVTATLATS